MILIKIESNILQLEQAFKCRITKLHSSHDGIFWQFSVRQARLPGNPEEPCDLPL